MTDYPLDVPRPDDEMAERMAAADAVESDNELSATEKGFTINGLGNEKFITLFTDKPTMVKSVLEHDLAVIESVSGMKSGSYETGGVDDLGEFDTVYGLRARLPLGVLTVKGSSRSSHTHSGVINTPSEVEAVADMFGGDE
jgi:hypothetical protein